MKEKIKYFTLLYITFVDLFSQDIIDPPKLTFTDNNQVIQKNYSSFMKGWNWGSFTKNFDLALNMKSAHGGLPTDTFRINNQFCIWWLTQFGKNNDNGNFQASSFLYEPCISVDTINKPSNDLHGAVFGFLDKTVGTVSGSRFELLSSCF